MNSTIMKQINRRMVLDSIRRGTISRVEIAGRTQLTRASVTQIVDSLIAEGLVIETVAVNSNRPGRRQTKLAIAEDALWIAGANISRVGYDLGLINLSGEIIWAVSGQIAGRGVSEVLDEIADRLRAALKDLGTTRAHIFGVGISAPGPLDACSGTILNPPYFREWHGAPVARMLGARTGMDAYLINLSDAHALDELYFGIGRAGIENFMLLRVDEAVNAGFILDGRPFPGARGQSPEIGHVTVERDGPPCDCGNRGCLEKYIAFPAVLTGTSFSSWEEVVDGLDALPEAEALFKRVAGDLAFEIINIVNVFDLEKIVLSGNFIYGGARLAEEVNRRIAGKSLRALCAEPVVAETEIQSVRIAAMSAYHTLFAG